MRPPSIVGSRRRWQMRANEIVENTEFVERCLRLWDKGYDTAEIATLMFQPESVVDSATRLGRERRRNEEAADGFSQGAQEEERP